jgi:hypothetical protein
LGKDYGSGRPFSSREDVNKGSFFVENRQEFIGLSKQNIPLKSKSITDGIDVLMEGFLDFFALKERAKLKKEYENEMMMNASVDRQEAWWMEKTSAVKESMERLCKEIENISTASEYDVYKDYSNELNPYKLFTFKNAMDTLSYVESENESYRKHKNGETTPNDYIPLVDYSAGLRETKINMQSVDHDGHHKMPNWMATKEVSLMKEGRSTWIKNFEIYSYPVKDFFWMSISDTKEIKGLSCQLFPWVSSVYSLDHTLSMISRMSKKTNRSSSSSSSSFSGKMRGRFFDLKSALSSISIGRMPYSMGDPSVFVSGRERWSGIPFNMFTESKTFMKNSRLPVIHNVYLLNQACLLPKYNRIESVKPLDSNNLLSNFPPFVSGRGKKKISIDLSQVMTNTLNDAERNAISNNADEFSSYVRTNYEKMSDIVDKFNEFNDVLEDYSFSGTTHFKDTFVNRTNMAQFEINYPFKCMINYNMDVDKEKITPSSFPSVTMGIGSVLPTEDLLCEHVDNTTRRFHTLLGAQGPQKQKILAVFWMMALGHMDPSSMGIHALLTGPYAVGKSWMLDILKKFTVEGIVSDMNDFTRNSFMVDGDCSGHLFCFEELASCFFNNVKGENMMADMLNLLKSFLSDGNFTKVICDISNGPRERKEIHSKFVVRIAGASNETIERLDPNIKSRIQVFTVTKPRGAGQDFWEDTSANSSKKAREEAICKTIKEKNVDSAGLTYSQQGNSKCYLFPKTYLKNIKEDDLLEFMKEMYSIGEDSPGRGFQSSTNSIKDREDEEERIKKIVNRSRRNNKEKSKSPGFDQSNEAFSTIREKTASENLFDNVKLETLIMFYTFMALSEKRLTMSSHVFWCLIPKLVAKLKATCTHLKIDNRTILRMYSYDTYFTMLAAIREEYFSPIDPHTGKRNPKYYVPFESQFVLDIAPRLFMRVSTTVMAFTMVSEEFINPWDSQIFGAFFYRLTEYGNFVKNLAMCERVGPSADPNAERYTIDCEVKVRSSDSTEENEIFVKQRAIRLPYCVFKEQSNGKGSRGGESLFDGCKFATFYDAKTNRKVINMNYVVLEEDCKDRNLDIVHKNLAERLDSILGIGKVQVEGMVKRLFDESFEIHCLLDLFTQNELDTYLSQRSAKGRSGGGSRKRDTLNLEEIHDDDEEERRKEDGGDYFYVHKNEKNSTVKTLQIMRVRTSASDVLPKDQLWLLTHSLTKVQSDTTINRIIKETLEESKTQESLMRLFNVDPQSNRLRTVKIGTDSNSDKGEVDKTKDFVLVNESGGFSSASSRGKKNDSNLDDDDDEDDSDQEMETGPKKTYFDYLKDVEGFKNKFSEEVNDLEEKTTPDTNMEGVSSSSSAATKDNTEKKRKKGEGVKNGMPMSKEDLEKDLKTFKEFVSNMEKELPRKFLRIAVDLDEWAAHEHLFSTHVRPIKLEKNNLSGVSAPGFRLMYFHKKIPLGNLHDDAVRDIYENAGSSKAAEAYEEGGERMDIDEEDIPEKNKDDLDSGDWRPASSLAPISYAKELFRRRWYDDQESDQRSRKFNSAWRINVLDTLIEESDIIADSSQIAKDDKKKSFYFTNVSDVSFPQYLIDAARLRAAGLNSSRKKKRSRIVLEETSEKASQDPSKTSKEVESGSRGSIPEDREDVILTEARGEEDVLLLRNSSKEARILVDDTSSALPFVPLVLSKSRSSKSNPLKSFSSAGPVFSSSDNNIDDCEEDFINLLKNVQVTKDLAKDPLPLSSFPFSRSNKNKDKTSQKAINPDLTFQISVDGDDSNSRME